MFVPRLPDGGCVCAVLELQSPRESGYLDVNTLIIGFPGLELNQVQRQVFPNLTMRIPCTTARSLSCAQTRPWNSNSIGTAPPAPAPAPPLSRGLSMLALACITVHCGPAVVPFSPETPTWGASTEAHGNVIDFIEPRKATIHRYVTRSRWGS
ncbi:uncharacterized protein LY79DRAFT_65240 [Colletotrichum navitas]|uniref:Uncharacterized protein n=1 Tax=Colletotrichum navitas TaxID=681940 RepID=A0AAD8Q669_9PEZI|nr:uncharacterized protein LY79DRAFT_65240 [Colletotrichum navitas]KAK1596455.1 hypothetical protein LY79DRAFT_65240 [Colletotrichum navitas]